MRHKQAKCKNCGPVMATTSDPMTPHEQMVGCGILLITCGLALPFVLWDFHRKEVAAKTYRCPNCGNKCK